MNARHLPLNSACNLRRWPRFAVEVPVQVYCDLPLRIHPGQGTALNAGGMAVHTPAILSLGDQIAVEFKPPGAQEPVRARCFVRNCNGQTYGIEFVTENDADYSTVGQIEYGLTRLAATA